VSVQASSLYTNSVAHEVTTGKAFAILTIVCLFTLVTIATNIHLFNFGNKPDAQEEVF
jgi:cbb3-type cytochrome oxidase subunit 3